MDKHIEPGPSASAPTSPSSNWGATIVWVVCIGIVTLSIVAQLALVDQVYHRIHAPPGPGRGAEGYGLVLLYFLASFIVVPGLFITTARLAYVACSKDKPPNVGRHIALLAVLTLSPAGVVYYGTLNPSFSTPEQEAILAGAQQRNTKIPSAQPQAEDQARDAAMLRKSPPID